MKSPSGKLRSIASLWKTTLCLVWISYHCDLVYGHLSYLMLLAVVLKEGSGSFSTPGPGNCDKSMSFIKTDKCSLSELVMWLTKHPFPPDLKEKRLSVSNQWILQRL